MKQFKEMIEWVKRNEIRISDTIQDHGHGWDKSINEAFFALVERCQPFVLFMKGDQPLDASEGSFDPKLPILSAPFQVYSLEMFGSNIHVTQPRPGDEAQVYTKCLLAYEVKPTQFLTFAYVKAHSAFLGGPAQGVHYVILTAAYNDILKQLTDRIAQEQAGFKAVNEKIKIGRGQTKRYHKIRKVIYVKPKGLMERPDLGTPEARDIEWTHRWWVRGHWRKHAGLGKDRTGDYTVEGFTWVTEHAKGPEDAPLIQKTRVVKP